MFLCLARETDGEGRWEGESDRGRTTTAFLEISESRRDQVEYGEESWDRIESVVVLQWKSAIWQVLFVAD